MEFLKKCVAAGVLMSVVTLAAFVLAPQPVRGAGSAPTTIVNTVDDPVPVTIQGAAGLTVTANQGGTWTVGLDSAHNTTNVRNSSTAPLFVRDTDNAALQPFQQELFSSSLNSPVPMVTVPTGKRLVVETFSAEAVVATGQTVNRFFLAIRDPGTSNVKFVHIVGPSSHGPSFGQEVFVATQQLRMYVDPGQELVVNAVGDGTGGAFMSVSGYFVNVP